MNMDTANPRCHICQESSSEGVGVAAGFICSNCLRLICGTQVGDTLYSYYVAKLKELWQAG